MKTNAKKLIVVSSSSSKLIYTIQTNKQTNKQTMLLTLDGSNQSIKSLTFGLPFTSTIRYVATLPHNLTAKLLSQIQVHLALQVQQ